MFDELKKKVVDDNEVADRQKEQNKESNLEDISKVVQDDFDKQASIEQL